MPRRLSSDANWPPTRRLMRSGPACITPEGEIAFCALQGLDDRLLVDAEGGELAGREFEVDHLVLRADQLDPADVRHGQHLARAPSST